MTWEVPRTFVAGEITTAAHMNEIRDNFKALVSQSARVDTSETRTATAYGDLATVGPAVTVTTDTEAYVIISAQVAHSAGGGIAHMAYAISGATTYAATDEDNLRKTSITANDLYAASRLSKRDGLTAGSNTFTAKYRVSVAGTGTWLYREIIVVPVGPAV